MDSASSTNTVAVSLVAPTSPTGQTRKPTVREVRAAAAGRWPEIIGRLAPECRDAIAGIGSTRHFECPSHGGENGDAFRFFEDAADTGGGVCNTCGRFSDGFNLLSWILNRSFDHIVGLVADTLGMATVPIRKPGRPAGTGSSTSVRPEAKSKSGQTKSQERELEIAQRRSAIASRWREAIPDKGRIAEYLASRGITIPVPPTLRLHEHLAYHEPDPGDKNRMVHVSDLPAMMAQVTSQSAGLVAIHRTYLHPNPEVNPGKAPVSTPKKLTTPIYERAMNGSAVRLYPIPTAYDNSPLAITEGIETALAVRQATELPVWSCISAGGLASVEIPHEIVAVEIFADHDEAGITAAETAAARLAVERPGRTVKIITPAISGQDWLDVLVAQPDADAAAKVFAAARIAAKPFVPNPDSIPRIEIETAEHRVVDRVVEVLAGDPTLFQRAGMLTMVIRDSGTLDGVTRMANSPRILPVPKPRLRERLTACAAFFKTVHVGESKEPREIDCHPPQWLVEEVHARGEWPRVRHLESVIECPYLAYDGTVVTDPGYSEKTGIYHEPTVDLCEIPEHPTQADAAAAAELLLSLVADFPFEKDAHRSAWVAAALTPLARFAFRGPAPMFLLDANVPGSGKSMLADIVSLIATGRPLARMTDPGDNDEMRKRIISIALAGDRLILVDNVSGMFGHDSLDAALTSMTVKDRILGRSEATTDIPLFATWFVTGNNIQVRGDLSRRTCHIRLESHEEKPEEREDFAIPAILDHVRANRSSLVAAVLTILRAYCSACDQAKAAGKPSPIPHLKPWGSFDGWSSLVRSAVVYAGLQDPGETRQAIVAESNSDAAFAARLIDVLEKLDSDGHGMTAAQMIDGMEQAAKRPFDFDLKTWKELRDVVLEFLPGKSGGLPTPLVLSRRIRQIKGRVVNSRCLQSRTHSNTNLWFIKKPKSHYSNDSLFYQAKGVEGGEGEDSSSSSNQKEIINPERVNYFPTPSGQGLEHTPPPPATQRGHHEDF